MDGRSCTQARSQDVEQAAGVGGRGKLGDSSGQLGPSETGNGPADGTVELAQHEVPSVVATTGRSLVDQLR